MNNLELEDVLKRIGEHGGYLHFWGYDPEENRKIVKVVLNGVTHIVHFDGYADLVQSLDGLLDCARN